MELTPQSARSPTSPFRYTSNPQPLYEYPSPAQSDSRYRSTESLQGLGLYSCPMTGSAVENGGSVTQVQPSTATSNWQTTALHHHHLNLLQISFQRSMILMLPFIQQYQQLLKVMIYTQHRAQKLPCFQLHQSHPATRPNVLPFHQLQLQKSSPRPVRSILTRHELRWRTISTLRQAASQ
jgi:hypothetical protein